MATEILPKSWYDDVLAFHSKLRPDQIAAVPSVPCGTTRQLRMDLVTEEYKELKEAWEDNDLVGIADAIADSIYVLTGMAIAYGIPLPRVWAEVHRTNMAKEGGPSRADGKVLKKPGWTPPDIAGILKEYERVA